MHVASPVDDSGLRRVGTRESKGVPQNKLQNIEKYCAIVVHGDRINNQHSGIHEINTYG